MRRMHFACRITEATDTLRIRNTSLSHDCNGYANTPHCYVIVTLPVLFTLLRHFSLCIQMCAGHLASWRDTLTALLAGWLFVCCLVIKCPTAQSKDSMRCYTRTVDITIPETLQDMLRRYETGSFCKAVAKIAFWPLRASSFGRMQQRDSNQTNLSKISYLRLLLTFLDTSQCRLKSDTDNRHFTCRPTDIYVSPLLVFSSETKYVLCSVRAEAEEILDDLNDDIWTFTRYRLWSIINLFLRCGEIICTFVNCEMTQYWDFELFFLSWNYKFKICGQ
jgi:hypothetical protein